MRFVLFTSGLIILSAATALGQGTVVSADTYVQNGAGASTNFGALANLLVGPGGAAATQYKSLLRFDLSGLGGVQASNVQKATLWLYVNRVTTAGAVDVLDVTTSWNESTATWNLSPLPGGTLGTIPVTAGAQWVGLDITTEVRTWLATPALNNGVALIPSVTASATAVSMDAKENTGTSHAPELQLVLSGAGGPSGATGPAGASGPAGPSGPVGPSGPSGPAGATGPVGPSGVAGASGPSGGAGPSGPVGPSGVIGPSGPSGVAGLTGASGPAGPTGAVGPVGPSGPSGATGSTGLTGATGPSGPAGSASQMFLSGVGQGAAAAAAYLKTNSVGQSEQAAVLPVSGYMSTPVYMPTIYQGVGFPWNHAGPITWFPAPVTLTKVNAILTTQDIGIFVGTTVTMQAQLYKYTTGYGTTVVPGAACTFVYVGTSLATFRDFMAGSATCSATFSASFNAGEGAFWLVSSTSSSTSQQPLTTSVAVDISIGTAQ